MNKISGKILSVLLAVLMVISVIPSFTVFATEDETPTVNSFLDSKKALESETGIYNYGVTWNDEKDAAYFDGSSSVKLKSQPLQNITASSGFIISMDVYNVDNNIDNKYLYFNNAESEENDFFAVDGSSAYWWVRYRTEISNGSNTRGYFTSDFTSTAYCDPTHSANGNDSYPVNEWYTLTLVMNPDGSYSYYRNYVLLATFKKNYITTGNGGGLTDESAVSVIKGLTDYYIGGTDDSGSQGFTGYIKNVVFSDTADDKSLIYQESFDDAEINGSNFTSSNGNGTIQSSPSNVSIAPQWDSDNGANPDGNGNANGLRKKVLKLNGNNGRPSLSKVVLDENPLNNPSDRTDARLHGATISYWRSIYLPNDENNNVVQFYNGSTFTSGIAFVGEDVSDANRYKYFEINATGTLSFNNGNVGNNGLPYIDILLKDNDPTTHATGTRNKAWVNFTVSIDPESGIKYYVNGKEYLTSINYAYAVENNALVSREVKSENYDSLNNNGNHRLDYENNGAMAKDLLELITSGNVKFELGGGDPYNTNYCETYIDDVRIYNNVLTQVEVNNMFADEFTDAYKAGLKNKLSTSHDPTNVTCYTLKEAVAGKPAGSQVGIEFIEYHNVDPLKYTVDYYSFGTDMTLYHSDDNINWTILGDDEGRCGYQNQKLYNGVYTDVLASQFEWCRTDATNAFVWNKDKNAYDINQTGAGYLQWAPHVMYNLTLDKWCYYGSTSDWGSARSCIFMGTSDNIEGPYTNIKTIFKSGGGYGYSDPSTPANAIDSCVYYGHKADGSIDINQLYCSYGSWGPNYVLTLNAATGLYGKQWGDDGYAGTCVFNTFDEGTSGWSGEGNYVVYENGYYYFYITLGHNGGNYQQRVFRSTSPTSGFVAINGNDALNESGNASPHGNPLITSYYLEGNEYAYTSVGHNSIYKAINNNDELVTINSTHTRPYATTSYSEGTVSMVDGALATRQVDHRGNLAIHNMVAYTKNGWPVALPLTYNGDDTTGFRATAYDLQGTYAGNALMAIVHYDYARATDMVITATSETEGYIKYGKYAYDFELEYGKDYKNDDITYINLIDADGDSIGEGVVAKQGSTYEFAFVDARTARHSWGYKKSSSIPSQADIISEVSTMPSAQTFDGWAYHEGSRATNAHSNVLYSTGDTSWSGSNSYNNTYVVVADQNMKIAMPRFIALVYDGEHDAYGPVLYEHKKDGNYTTNTKYIYPNDSDYILKDYWYGYTTAYNDWPGNSKNADSNNAYFGYNTSTIHQTNNSNTDQTRFFWNKLYYNGTGDTKKYYTRTYRQTFTAMGYTSNGRTDKTGTIYSNNTQIVINYKPLYDILNGTTKVSGTDLTLTQAYQETLNNPDKYTTSSLRNLYKAMQIIKSVNIKEYEYWSNPENASIEAACAVKAAVEAFNAVELDEKADLTALDKAFNKADALLNNLDGKVAQYDSASVTALKNAVMAENVSTYVNADAEERADYGAAVQSEANTLAANINSAYNNLTATASSIDTSAFESAVNTINNIDPEAYDSTTESISSAISTANGLLSTETVGYGTSTISVVKSDVTLKDVNDATNRILTALNSSIKEYKVDADDSDIKEISFKNGTYYTDSKKATYGTKMTFRSDDDKTAWYLELKTATTHKNRAYAGSGKTFETAVVGDIKVEAVVESEELNCRVTISRSYNNDPDKAPIEYLNYVASGTEIDLPAAPSLAFYTFKGYYIGETKLTESSITINEDTEIIAKYEVNEGASCAINATDVNDGDHNTSAAYNERVELDGGSGAYAWIEEIDATHYRPFYIGENISFLATEGTTLKAVDEDEFNAFGFSLPTVNLRKSGVITSDERTIFNGQLVAENLDDIREYGILIGVPIGEDGILPNEQQLIVDNTGAQTGYRVVRAKSTKLVGANQFTIAIRNMPAEYVYRAYVIYKDKTSLQTAYSEIK